MKRRKVNLDRISELPEFIIHQIMSNLPREQVGQLSILSKTWNLMQKNYPVLDFCIKWNNIGEDLKNHIHRSLHHFRNKNLSLQSFSLEIEEGLFPPELPSVHDAWLQLATDNGVRELKLRIHYSDLHYNDPEKYWKFPKSISCCKTLEVLELDGYYINQPLSSFSFLTKLSLENCNNLNDPVFLKCGDCPLLQVLVLRSCFGVLVANIENLPRLHTVELYLDGHDDLYRVENFDEDDDDDDDGGGWFFIAGQSIERLTIFTSDFRSWSIIDIDNCPNLKSLHLHSEKITDEEFHSLLLKFPLLEELYVFKCNSLERIEISNTKIHTLEICVGDESRLDSVKIEAPNLESFIFIAHQKQCAIEIADCCCNLVSLVLHWSVMTEALFHNLVSKFPLLENLWISGCNKLERVVHVRNPKLERLYVVKCRKIKDDSYKFGISNSCEFYFKAYEGEEEPKDSVNAATTSLDTNWYFKLVDFLWYFVGIQDVSLINMIHESLF